jgi:hypothetical protein
MSKSVGKFQALFRPTKCLYQHLTLESLNTEALNVEILSKEERLGVFPRIGTYWNYLEHWMVLDWITYIIVSDTVKTGLQRALYIKKETSKLLVFFFKNILVFNIV